MRGVFRFALFMLFSGVLLGDEPLAPTTGVSKQEPRTYGEPVLRHAQNASATPRIASLPRMSDQDVEAVRRWNDAGNSPQRGGLARELDAPVQIRNGGVFAAETGALWRWRGRVEVASAAQLRLQLTDVSAPPEAVFWVYGDDGEAQGFDVSLAHERTIWTPSIFGSGVTLEVQAPAAAEIHFDIRGIAEVFEPRRIQPEGDECLQDATCFSLGSLKAGVGLMTYIKNGQPYICSGGLMNERRSTFIPYFLTANHCISTAAEAASLEVYWDYDTAFCGASQPSLANSPRSTGSTLLTTSAATDVTLLRLNSLPGYRWFFGWDPNPVAAGTHLRRISHPNGWTHGYSESIVSGSVGTCTSWGRPNFIYSTNWLGSAAGGSSGSPVFYGDGYVVGQLTGSCGLDVQNPCSLYANRVDGSLAMSWPLLKPYLDPVVTATCTPNSTTACILNGRFRVAVNYRNQFATPPKNGDFLGQRLNPAATNPDMAIFGFDNPQNVEVVVRIVDARPFAPRFDVYYGGLTDVEYWVNVTDTLTNRTKQYRNPPGSVGGGVDRSTFPAQ